MPQTTFAALLVFALTALNSKASAQSCPPQAPLLCADGCCPYGDGGRTDVCCPNNQCTRNGNCGGGGGGGEVCPDSAPLECADGCCPYGDGNRTDVCCPNNQCTRNGQCADSGGGETVCPDYAPLACSGGCCPMGDGGRTDVCCPNNTCTSNGQCGGGSGGNSIVPAESDTGGDNVDDGCSGGSLIPGALILFFIFRLILRRKSVGVTQAALNTARSSKEQAARAIVTLGIALTLLLGSTTATRAAGPDGHAGALWRTATGLGYGSVDGDGYSVGGLLLSTKFSVGGYIDMGVSGRVLGLSFVVLFDNYPSPTVGFGDGLEADMEGYIYTLGAGGEAIVFLASKIYWGLSLVAARRGTVSDSAATVSATEIIPELLLGMDWPMNDEGRFLGGEVFCRANAVFGDVEMTGGSCGIRLSGRW